MHAMQTAANDGLPTDTWRRRARGARDAILLIAGLLLAALGGPATAAADSAPLPDGAVGLANVAGHGERPPVTVWYPTRADEAHQAVGMFDIVAAPGAAMAPGRYPAIVMSHGSGGSTIVQHALARVLVRAGFIVAAPTHARDNWQDMSGIGPSSWRSRPREMSAVLDWLIGESAWSASVDPARIGAYGMSAGGLTVLTLAGGAWSAKGLLEHCRDNGSADPGFCEFRRQRVGAETGDTTADWPDGLYSAGDPRIRAVVAAVPVAAPFDAASLAAITIPLGLVVAPADIILRPAFHTDRVLLHAPTATVLGTLAGGHDAILSPWPADLAAQVGLGTPGLPAPDAATLDTVYRDIAAFFAGQLGPSGERPLKHPRP